MTLGSTRVLRERRPSLRQHIDYPDAYQSHSFSASEQSTAFNSPASSNWLPDDSSLPYDPSEYGQGTPLLMDELDMGGFGQTTSPTPTHSDVGIADPRFAGSTYWTRSTSAPRSKVKKTKKTKADPPKSIMPGDKPVPILSQTGEGPIQEIERFVHRSTERRLQEVKGKNGYTPRPMNNFMLYRKAYQDMAKQVSSQTNHQVVSVIVAASWKNEPKEIKETFGQYAQIEKQHHNEAFPDYQFKPNKGAKGKKRKAEYLTEEASDLEDLDWGISNTVARERMPTPSRFPTSWHPEQQYPYPQAAHPYQPPNYPVDHAGYALSYDQAAQFAYYPELEHDNTGWQYVTQSNQPFNTSVLSSLPGSGNTLLNPSNFDNSVFGNSMTTGQDPLPHGEAGSGPFTQAQFEALGGISAATDWHEPHPSLSTRTLQPTFESHAEDYAEEFLGENTQ